MNKFIYSLIAMASLLGGCDVFEDVTVDHRGYIHRCPANFQGNPEANKDECPRDILLQVREEWRESGPDWQVGMSVTKLGAGNEVCIYAALDETFQFTILSGGDAGKCFSGREAWMNFGSNVLAGNDIYVKACYDSPGSFDPFNFRDNFVYCTPVHKYHIQNDKEETPKYWSDSYRKLEAEVLGMTLSCANESVAGVMVCYAWETQQLILANQSNTAVHFTMEVKARNSVVADQWYMDAGDIDILEAKDISEGDEVSISAWTGYLESIVDVALSHEPDAKARITMTKEEILTVVREASTQEAVAVIPQLQGVDCQLKRKVMTETESGTQTVVGDTLVCGNSSTDDVEVQIWQLKQRSVTDTTYVRDFRLVKFELNGKDSQETPTASQNLTIPLDPSKHYLLDVRTTGWWGNPDLRSVQPFSIAGSGVSWTIALLPSSSYYEDAPAE